VACGVPTTSTPAASPSASGAAGGELDGIKTYLLRQTAELSKHTAQLKTQAEQYYQLAQVANFDYATLWNTQRDQVAPLLLDAKETWQQANPAYERMEGVVAGVPSLAEYDVILDAGGSAESDPENAVPFDLTLPDGRVLKQPGNFFFVTETTLWGTEPSFVAQGVEPDLDGNGVHDFGEVLPDANVLAAAATDMHKNAEALAESAQAWQPTPGDAFTALAVMTPTMNEYFEAWKQSRFVSGDTAAETAFVASSRLMDITDILSGLDVIYRNVEPLIAGQNAAISQQIGTNLHDLQAFVNNVREQEQNGKRFTAEEADLLGAQAQSKATAIAGQVAQAAAQAGVEIAE
jgi:hypothetical protein